MISSPRHPYTIWIEGTTLYAASGGCCVYEHEYKMRGMAEVAMQVLCFACEKGHYDATVDNIHAYQEKFPAGASVEFRQAPRLAKEPNPAAMGREKDDEYRFRRSH